MITDFKLLSQLTGAWLKLKKEKKTEEISVKRPFYRDELQYAWKKHKYRILRSESVVRHAKIYRDDEYLARVEEKLGLLTHFDVFEQENKIFEIQQYEGVLRHEYRIIKNGKQIGHLKYVGIYVPVVSEVQKGLEGNFKELSETEQEVLMAALLAIGV